LNHDPASPRPLSRSKKLLFYFILAALLLAILEVSARVGLKAMRGFDGKHLYQYEFDPYKNIHPTPNFVDTRGIRHNSAGFRRSTEVDINRTPGTYRIMLMGASTAYGLGGLWPHIQRDFAVLDNSETIDAYLERLFTNAVPGVKVEVINAAITSTWTHHHLIYLNQRILKYQPDMILFLDGFNDFFKFERNHDQFASYSYNLQSKVILGEPTFKSLFAANGWWLFRKSAAAHVASRGGRMVKQALTRREEQKPLNVDSAVAGLKRNFPNNALKMHERAGLILQAENIRTVFMLQPLLILERSKKMSEVERKLFNFNVESYSPNYEQYMLNGVPFVRAEEAAMAQRVGAQFIDLTGIYAGVSEQIYTDYAHLTPLGNRLAAERIFKEILPTVQSDVQGKPSVVMGDSTVTR
jgi:lysophospholipase L1-like esterase